MTGTPDIVVRVASRQAAAVIILDGMLLDIEAIPIHNKQAPLLLKLVWDCVDHP